MDMHLIFALIILAPLIGSLLAGLLGKYLQKTGVNWITVSLMVLSFGLSCYVAYDVLVLGHTYNYNIYSWATIGELKFSVGLMVDQITVYMILVVTFVSTLVHIYSIGYMHDDPSYARFFSYISGFTFAMLCLVMGNNFLMLFFGWEGVGLASYLLIGFWFDKPKATYASLKAFLANRVGDLGFLLGIAVVLLTVNSLQYTEVFAQIPKILVDYPDMYFMFGIHADAVTLMCVLLFIGAMGKSAQVPLHIWLEGSMEGPTPISALIHAATMVTAGVFMVARLSPMFEFSQVALSTVLVIGATTCFFMGLLAIVQTDIKRIIAYSTLSQLGYMMVAQGASAYSVGMFHLMTHAAFKALLFLAAGSVILGMHHEQDIRKMGGLKKYMPITYICMLIGGLALAAIPPFAGFFSKDLIIDSALNSTIPGHGYAGFMVVATAFITAFYTFRMIFYVFHGKGRMTAHERTHIKESSFSVLIALILLAIPAAFAGIWFFEPALHGFFGNSIYVAQQYDVVGKIAAEHSTSTPWTFMAHSIYTLPFWLSIAGVAVAYVFYVLAPSIPDKLAKMFHPLYWFLLKKYLFDDIYDNVFGRGVWILSFVLWRLVDVILIDKTLVHGSANAVYYCGTKLRKLQTGYLYNYGFVMVVGMLALLFWMLIN